MTKDEISKYAFVEDLPDREMNCAERCLWYALRDVYRRFQSGSITKAQGDAEKNKAVKQYELDSAILNGAARIIEQSANMWTEIELASIMYNMDRTLENADAFVRAVYGVKRKEEGGSTGTVTGSDERSDHVGTGSQ